MLDLEVTGCKGFTKKHKVILAIYYIFNFQYINNINIILLNKMDNKSNIQIKPGSERSFGLIFFIFFLVIGVYTHITGKSFSVYFYVISMIFLFFAIFFAKYLRTLNIIWFKFGILLNSIISPIVMLLIFFCVFLPIGIIMKVIKKDLINIKTNNLLKSYWNNKEEKKINMNKQF